MFSLVLASAVLSQEAAPMPKANPLAAYFRTEEQPYVILPPEDLGFENILNGWQLDSDLVLLVSPQLQGFKESVFSPEDTRISLLYFQGKTKRRYPVQVNLLPDTPYEIKYLTEKSFLVTIDGENLDEGSNYLVDRETGRSLRLSAGVVQVSEEHNLIALLQDREIRLYNLSGEEQGRLPAPGLSASPHSGGLLFGSSTETRPFFDLATRTFRYVRQSDLPTSRPESVPPYYAFLAYSNEPTNALVGSRLWVMPTKLPRQNDSGKKPHEVPRPVEPVGSVQNGWILDGDLYYIQSLRLFCREIKPIAEEVYLASIVKEYQDRAMQQARMVVVALSIYANDHHAFPEGDWRTALAAYTRNSSVLDGFTYAGNPGNPTSLDRITEIPLGWVETPYGRAITYVDGSVRWKPNP